MHLVRIVPDLPSADPESTAHFYSELLHMKLAMSHGWIATLTSPADPGIQLSLINTDAAAPVSPAVSVEVSDVDAVHANAVRLGLNVLYPSILRCRSGREHHQRSPASTAAARHLTTARFGAAPPRGSAQML
jgi:hypothetical protein